MTALRGNDRLLAGLRVLWASVLLIWSAQCLQAEVPERIALVIGNATYQSVSSLDNAVADAELMAKTLEEQGFDVTLMTDVNHFMMGREIAQFGRALREGGEETTGLFFYAGHAVQSFGVNYLLPVDAVLTDAADLGLVAVPAEAVLRQMYSARNRTNIVILDSCRNNPFSDLLDLNDNGLAEMRAPTGTFLSYSTAPGSVALDGLDGHSPFTRALSEHITAPGLQIEQVFKNVRRDVIARTNGAQTPWEASSLTTDFVFAPEIAAPQPAAAPADLAVQEALIAAARDSGAAEDFATYLELFPDGVFAETARYEISLRQAAEAASEAADAGDETEAEVAALSSRAALGPMGPEITWDMPFTNGGDDVRGFSIADLLQSSPSFPPIEGLPDPVWKGQVCSNCHQWSRSDLCDQGVYYATDAAPDDLLDPHPFGGVLKINLRSWAIGGCK